MISIIGTSHIARQSIEEVEKAVSEKPGCVAVELDIIRYQNLVNKKPEGHFQLSGTSVILWLFKKMQEWLGSKVGILPGSEMLAAIQSARRHGIPVGLIDQDIRVTVGRIKSMPKGEKFKLFWYLFKAPFLIKFSRFSKGEKIDISKIPEDKIIDFAIEQFSKEFPHLYRILVDERNVYMVKKIRELEKQFGDVLVVVGAGHEKGLKQILESQNKSSPNWNG